MSANIAYDKLIVRNIVFLADLFSGKIVGFYRRDASRNIDVFVFIGGMYFFVVFPCMIVWLFGLFARENNIIGSVKRIFVNNNKIVVLFFVPFVVSFAGIIFL